MDETDEGLEPVPVKRKRVGAHVVSPEGLPAIEDIDQRLANEISNDYGNAQRLIARFGEDLRYVKSVGWFAWNGIHWSREDGDDMARKLAHKTALAVWREAEAVRKWPGRKDEEKADRLMRHAVQSGNTGAVNAMLAAAAPYLSIPVESLDTDPFLLACPNGTVELGPHCEFRESRRSDFLTKHCGVQFETGRDCPTWRKFIERIMPDADMRDFLQRVIGYCLTGSTRDQALFLFYGTGLNGKSTLVNVLRALMGDYAMVSPISTFLAKREGGSGGDASPDVARLAGARLVTAAEPPEGAKLDEGKIKEITGGEPLTARHLNQGFFTFRPVFKVLLSTNHQPTIRGVDHGIWRRIRLIPFTVEIPINEIDRDLETKLLEEASAIFQWMLDGVEQWFEMGLSPPAAAIAAVENYRADQDMVGQFLRDCCARLQADNPVTGRPYEETAHDLYEAFQRWCGGENLDPISKRAFGTKITARGITPAKSRLGGNGGTRVYRGVTLKAQDQWRAE